MRLVVGPLPLQDYLGFVADRPMSYLQSPSWGTVRCDWESERLGWRDEDGTLVGAGLVLYRRLPLGAGSLAFLSEGPVLDWADHDGHEVLAPLVDHVRHRGAVSVRVGPDLVLRTWRASTVKSAVGAGRTLDDVPVDSTNPVAERLGKELAAAGWVLVDGSGRSFGSTRHAFRVELGGRTPEDLLAGMNQQWRRSIRTAEKAGVEVRLGGYEDLADFHRVYVDTALRDGFPPQPLEYFQRFWSALSPEAPDRVRLYLGRYSGEVLAGMLVVTSGGVAGYAYGGSASHSRKVSPSHAVHWQILQDLVAEGVDVYDMRGVDDTIDPDERKFGILRFKLGTGGDVVENLGDWELPLRPLLHRGVVAALSLRNRLQVVTALRVAGAPESRGTPAPSAPAPHGS